MRRFWPMKRFWPQSLLARTVWLLALLLILSQIAWLVLFSLYEREPRARQIAHRAAAIVNLTRAALLAAHPDKRRILLQELSQREGVQVLPLAPEESDVPPPHNAMATLVTHEIRRELGPDTLVSFSDDNAEDLWVSFAIDADEYWVIMPRLRQAQALPWFWAGWGAGVLLLSIFGAWLMLRRINRPLLQTAEAAALLGRGETPPRLAERGPQEIATLAHAFNQMADNINLLETNRSLMLAGISHDLRTPLTRLRLATEMNVGDEAERHAMIQDMDDMETLTRQFMDFARQDTEETVRRVDLGALLDEISDSFAQRGLAVAHNGAGYALHARPQALRRALVNLLENAHRYGSPPVEVQLRQDENSLALSVIDHGAGLPQGQLESIKQPFRSGESARTGARGTGLGLAIVERVARLHHGSLTLHNRPGGGFEVRLTLPL